MKTFSQGTDTWKRVTEGMIITAYEPAIVTGRIELEVIEPGKAVNLSAAERARMNQAKPGAGARMKPERL